MATLPGEKPSVVIDFLKRTLPFSLLDQELLASVAQSCSVDFHPSGTQLLVQGVTRMKDLLVVQKGGVKLTLRTAQTPNGQEVQETLLDYRGEGGFLGELSLIQDRPAQINATTVEDTFFLRIGKDVFLSLIKTQPLVAEYFLRDFSENYLPRVFSEMRSKQAGLTCDSGLYLFSTRVGEMVTREPVSASFGETIQMAAWKMTKHNVGSLLVREPSGEMAGIVTDKDLRKAVALGMDYGAPIETIMSTPVAGVDESEVCFDALLRMMTRQIHHLSVTSQGAVIGVVTAHDIMVLQGKSPMALFRDIQAQESIEGLYPLGAKMPQVLHTLVEEGARAGHITRMITVFNDLILEKLLKLLLRDLGPPPAPFCWLLMGSEGRREQTIATDQDNALVYKDLDDDILQRAADVYFTAFTERAIQHLVRCGYPPCNGGIMASNPKWRLPYSAWRDNFERWIMVPEPQEVLHATIFFDFRPAFGQESFATELRDHIARHAPRQEVFLRHLAADCLSTRPPLSFFRNFVVEKSGEHKNRLDIKRRGLMPFVDFARVLALKHGVKETNTLTRLRALREAGHIPDDLHNDAAEAFEFLLQLRLVHQLVLVENGETPNNHIDPASLSELERQTLKESFAIIGRLQSFLRDMFRLNIA
ncbi:MAG: putative nucleotidyltransferase substrate binding domain-containing protein [Desulfovibrionaceae bacterium]